MIEQALTAFLGANSGLNALISGRISPSVLPELSPLPAIVYQVIDAPREHYMPDGAFTGFNSPRIQFKCFGTTYGSSAMTAAALIAALEGFIGLMGSPAVYVYGVLPEDQRDDEEAYSVGRLYVRMVDCKFLHA